MPRDDDRIVGAFDALRRTQSQTTYRRAESEADRRAVFALRHDAYAREGAIEPRPDGLLRDAFDDMPHSHTIMVEVCGRLAGTIRLHHLSPGSDRGSPALEVFSDVLEPLLAGCPGGVLEPNCFAIDHHASAVHAGLAHLVLRAPCVAAEWWDVDAIIATVRQEHQAFYRRVLRCVPRVAPRAYPGRTKALGLMVVDFRAEWPGVQQRYPFFALGGEDWCAVLGRRWDAPC